MLKKNKMHNIFTLAITLLLTIPAFSQHLETSFNIVNYRGHYSTQNHVNLYNESTSTSLNNENNYQLGLKARYLKQNNSLYEIEVKSIFGSNELNYFNSDQERINSRINPQPTILITSGLGLVTNIKKIRFSTVLKLGLYKISPAVTKTEKRYSNNILNQTEIITGHQVNGVLFGPNIGVDYKILKRFYFGVSLDFLLNFRENIGLHKQKIIYYNPDGSVDDILNFHTEFDSSSIDLAGLQVSWNFSYRIF